MTGRGGSAARYSPVLPRWPVRPSHDSPSQDATNECCIKNGTTSAKKGEGRSG